MTMGSMIVGFIICLILAFIGVYMERVNNAPAGKILKWFGFVVAIIIAITYLFSMV
jgi:hypothetical protein